MVTLSVSMVTPSAEITWPRYATEVALNKHLECLRCRWWVRRALRTMPRC
jgi:hypothetical protein